MHPCYFDRLEIRATDRRLLIDGLSAPLGARAFDVLLALVERRDRTVTKNELIDLVWRGLVVEENNLQVQISTLRKLLGPQAISTVPGRGYRFTGALDVGPGAALEPRPPDDGSVVASSVAETGMLDTKMEHQRLPRTE